MPNQMPKKKLTRYLQKHEKVRFQIWQTWGSCYWGRGRRQPTRVGRSQRLRVFDSAIFTFIIPIHELLVEMLILGGFLKWWVSPTGPWVLFRNKKGSPLGVWNGGKTPPFKETPKYQFRTGIAWKKCLAWMLRFVLKHKKSSPHGGEEWRFSSQSQNPL